MPFLTTREAFVESFQPIINLLVLLTALSVAAERITNLVKLRNPDLRNRTKQGLLTPIRKKKP